MPHYSGRVSRLFALAGTIVTVRDHASTGEIGTVAERVSRSSAALGSSTTYISTTDPLLPLEDSPFAWADAQPVGCVF
jgi:hypothetical protein